MTRLTAHLRKHSFRHVRQRDAHIRLECFALQSASHVRGIMRRRRCTCIFPLIYLCLWKNWNASVTPRSTERLNPSPSNLPGRPFDLPLLVPPACRFREIQGAGGPVHGDAPPVYDLFAVSVRIFSWMNEIGCYPIS